MKKMIYPFKCSKCDYKDEVFLSYKNRTKNRVCPKCQKVLNRIIGKPLFNLKGNDWSKKGIQ